MKDKDKNTYHFIHQTSCIKFLLICIQYSKEYEFWIMIVHYFLLENENHYWHLDKRKLKFEKGLWLPLYPGN